MGALPESYCACDVGGLVVTYRYVPCKLDSLHWPAHSNLYTSRCGAFSQVEGRHTKFAVCKLGYLLQQSSPKKSCMGTANSVITTGWGYSFYTR